MARLGHLFMKFLCPQPKAISILLGSLLCAVSMWLYANRVLIPYQMDDAKTRDRPRGNLSDLYPRWIGARELLLHGRDPYSADVTREIQAGYYGRPLDSLRPGDPRDQQAFAYPVYVVFYLAPSVRLSFGTVERGFFWILTGLTSLSVLAWLRMLNAPDTAWIRASAVALALGSLPIMQGLKLEQISLLVAALMSFAIACLVADYPILAGIVLALATIKPQLVFPLLVWLGLWTSANWRGRYRWTISFLGTMTILMTAAEWCLPGWLSRFWQAVGQYRDYTDAASVLQNLLPEPLAEGLLVAIVLATIFLAWGLRKEASSGPGFVIANCLILAVTVLVLPTSSLYNQALLFPAVLMLALEWKILWRQGLRNRTLVSLTATVAAWPWLTSMLLVVAAYAQPASVFRKTSSAPFWAALLLPPLVTLLLLVQVYRKSLTFPSGPMPGVECSTT